MRGCQNVGRHWALVLLIVVVWCRCGAAQDLIMRRAIARKALEESVVSLQSLSCRFDSEELRVEAEPAAPEHWISMESGRRALLTRNGTPSGAGLKSPYTWMSSDGDRGFWLKPREADPRQIELVVVSAAIVPQYQSFVRPAHFIGRPFMLTAMTPANAVAAERVEFLSEVRVHDAACWKFMLPDLLATSGARKRLTFWLDPQAGFLPRRYVVAPDDADLARLGEPGYLPTSTYYIFDILRFEFLADEATGTARPFPAEGTVVSPQGRWRYRFLETRLNPELAASDFRPRAQANTKLEFRGAAGQQDVQVGRAQEWLKRLADEPER